MSLVVNIKKRFASFSLNVSFSTEGGIYSLLGCSGSGKSVTLKCLAGIITPDEGEIILDGKTLYSSEKHINLPPQKRKVGYMFQNYALFPNMTVKQNIMVGMSYLPSYLSFIKKSKYQEIIKLLRLERIQFNKPHQISGGEAQRVALARILVSSPQIILLDEPFSALDEHLRTHLQIEMKDILTKYGKEVIIVTHDKNEALLLSSHVATIDKGSIINVLRSEKIFSSPIHRASAELLGYKNFSLLDGNNSSWGIKVNNENNYRYITISNDSFSLYEKENRHLVKVINRYNSAGTTLVTFKFIDSNDSKDLIYWNTKEELPSDDTFEVGFKNKSLIYLID